MNRKLIVALLFLGMLICTTTQVQAIILDTKQFVTDTDPLGTKYDTVSDSLNYIHNFILASSLSDATLTLTHKMNANIFAYPVSSPDAEIWLVSAFGDIHPLGMLNASEDWVTQSFDLASVLTQINSSWSVAVNLTAYPVPNELWLSKSVLSGNYTVASTPEPGSMMLLGTGLLGLLGFTRKRIRG